MEIIADLHIHSRFARATSKSINIENLEKWARIKGLNVLGTGDFQHPEWNKEIKKELKEDEKGILWSKTGFPFIWQSEISFMYSQNEKGRAIHLVVLAPNGETADKIIEYLKGKGRIDYDGRPIFGVNCRQFIREIKEIDDRIELIPAHCLLPSEKILCDYNVMPISEVSIGDKVLTHTGNYKKVTNVFTRDYSGSILKIKPYYFSEGINVTSEHPFLAIKTKKDCSYVGGLCKLNSICKGKHICKKKHYEKYNSCWVMAKNLEVNDVLLYPRKFKSEDLSFLRISDELNKQAYRVKGDFIYPTSGRQDVSIKNIVKVNPDFCRLIGYYLAEGYVIPEKNSLWFSFGKHEIEYIKDVIKLMEDFFSLRLAKKEEKRGGCSLCFYSKVLVDLFSKLFYLPNKKLKAPFKKIPQWMLYLPENKKAELFKGWWRGDYGVTTSEILSQQMKLMCLSLGIIPSMYKQKKEKSLSYNSKILGRLIKATSDQYYLHNLSFFEDKFGLLNDNSFKKFKTKIGRRHGWIDDMYIYIPIKEIDEYDYDGKVYNLEVEEDNSYLTISAAVHNCMTSWFGIFGSERGFNSLNEAFGEQAKHIYAVESGMSANPEMLWRFKEKVNVVSFSDMHSFWPWRIGREATIFEMNELSYENIISAIRTGKGLKATIETPPEYGKYHWDGHRNCGFSCNFEESRKLNGKCPKCGNGMTIGVEYRVEEIAKEAKGWKPENARKFYELIPLHELIALAFDIKMESKKAWEVYNLLIEKFGNEIKILMNVSRENLENAKIDEKLVELILLGREGKLKVKPGFDGEYGKVLMPEKQAKL